MAKGVDVAPQILDSLHIICASLPEAYEEQAWVGTRWRIRQQTFVHVLTIADGWPPAYVRAFGTEGPATVLTFQSAGEELESLTRSGPPFVRPPWRPGIVGMVLPADPGDADWGEIGELVTDSYCLLAPKKLADSVPRPR